MRKLILFLLLFVSIQSFSQLKLVSTITQYAFWRDYSKIWEWSKPNYTTVPIYITKEVIWMENKSRTRFTIKKSYDIKPRRRNEDGILYDELSWDAVDNAGRKCKLLLLFYLNNDNNVVFAVMYDDVAFKFHITSQEILSEEVDKFF